MTEMAYGASASETGDSGISEWWRTVDRLSIAAVLALFLIGMLLALAASPPLALENGLERFYYVKRQAIYGVLGLGVMIFLSTRSIKTVRRLAVLGFIAVLLGLMVLPWIGTDYGKGAVRWVSLGFGSIQPSEFIKPLFAVTAAWLLAASTDIGGPPGRMISFILMMVIVFLLISQPDYGQAALVLASWGTIFFVGGAPKKLIFTLAGLAVGGGYLAYVSVPHVARRIDGFLSADVDPLTQIGFATSAIQDGGLFGVGIGAGTVKWTLPDAHTDFIIAVAAEEFGLLFTLVIIALFMLLTMRSLLRLRREGDMFIRLTGVGLVTVLGAQALINLGVAVRLLPSKGMTLPFVSYGGSSLLAAGIMMGMLFAMTRKRPQGDMSELLGGGP
ncbi:MAG: putative lipid II flippase FtsW [Rhodobacteraceae bacterium]|nr:putative lipid II flippase FtsW [Paracoccaceae bacterium]